MAELEKIERASPYCPGQDLVRYYHASESLKPFQQLLGFCQLTLVQNASLERVLAMVTSLLKSTQLHQSGERLTAMVRLRLNSQHVNAARRKKGNALQPCGVVPDIEHVLENDFRGNRQEETEEVESEENEQE